MMDVCQLGMPQDHFVLVQTTIFLFSNEQSAKSFVVFLACDCNLSGVTDDGSCYDFGTVCNVVPGECTCSPNYSGTKCDECVSGYYKVGNLCSRKKEMSLIHNSVFIILSHIFSLYLQY